MSTHGLVYHAPVLVSLLQECIFAHTVKGAIFIFVLTTVGICHVKYTCEQSAHFMSASLVWKDAASPSLKTLNSFCQHVFLLNQFLECRYERINYCLINDNSALCFY